MERRTLLTALAATVFLPHVAHANEPLLRAVSSYLNAIDTAGGRFRQQNADGSVARGQYWIDRPGLMRFQYDPPNAALIIADGLWLGIVDPVPGTQVQRYPLNLTPLQLLLDDKITLEREKMVQAVEERDGHIIVRAQDPDRPEIGTIALVFRSDPVQLVQWVTLDAAGQQTSVVLETMTEGEDFPRALFSIEQAEFLRDR
jgi:outer membrane lipoprotein-sorting protein